MITFFELEWTTCIYRNPCAKVTTAMCLIGSPSDFDIVWGDECPGSSVFRRSGKTSSALKASGH